jgi:hypothetical protein
VLHIVGSINNFMESPKVIGVQDAREPSTFFRWSKGALIPDLL